MKRKLISSIAAISLAVASAVSLTSSASGTPRDPNGDGAVNMSDAVFITQHLVGSQHPSNLTPLDFDQNGIISQVDTYKVQLWCLNSNNVPDRNPNDPVVAPSTGTRSYRRHDYHSGSLSSYTSYSLTTSITLNNGVNMTSIVEPNDMVRDYDTAIVKLSNGNSGFIVGDHIIATTADSDYNRTTSKFKSFTVNIVGSGANVLATYSPRYVHIPTSYAYGSMVAEHNYALVYIEEDLSQYGKLKMGEALDSYGNGNNPIIVSGFPTVYPDGYSNAPDGIRFKALGSTTGATPYYLYYNVDSTDSEFGGPVYAEEGVFINNELEDYKTVIAIHSDSNKGIRINGNILKFYYTNNHLTS